MYSILYLYTHYSISPPTRTHTHTHTHTPPLPYTHTSHISHTSHLLTHTYIVHHTPPPPHTRITFLPTHTLSPIDGSVDLNALLDQLNQSSQTEVTVKSEILHTVLGIFQLDSTKKSAFREVSGFYYLISVLASLIGGLSPRRSNPWLEGTYGDVCARTKLHQSCV